MTRAEAIEHLKNIAIYSFQDGYTDEARQALDMAIKALEEPQWIPCKEALPKKNCRCLTTNKAWGAFEVDWNVWLDGHWLYQNDQPVAWKPLPEPWEGEKDG